MSAINSCPFCGGEAEVKGSPAANYTREVAIDFVGCKRCGAHGPSVAGSGDEESRRKSREKVLKLWNAPTTLMRNMNALLRKVEWSSTNYYDDDLCPVCAFDKRYKKHSPKCRLATLMMRYAKRNGRPT